MQIQKITNQVKVSVKTRNRIKTFLSNESKLLQLLKFANTSNKVLQILKVWLEMQQETTYEETKILCYNGRILGRLSKLLRQEFYSQLLEGADGDEKKKRS